MRKISVDKVVEKIAGFGIPGRVSLVAKIEKTRHKFGACLLGVEPKIRSWGGY